MKYVIITVLGLLLAGCQHLWSGKHQKKASMLELYTVEGTPTRPDQQVQGQLYVFDFATVHPVILTSEESAALYAALINTDNFSSTNQKRCPFIGQYAVRVGDELSAVISRSPCSKIQIKEGSKGDAQHLQLVKENSLEIIFSGLDSLN